MRSETTPQDRGNSREAVEGKPYLSSCDLMKNYHQKFNCNPAIDSRVLMVWQQDDKGNWIRIK